MVCIELTKRELRLTEDIRTLAEQWNAKVVPTGPAGFVLMPDYIYAIHGIGCEEREGIWRFWREAEATTWEDFLLMHITHTLAARHNSLLAYEGIAPGTFVEPTPDSFATFDHYAAHVTRRSEGVVKEMKLRWLYAHQKRYVR